MKSEVWRDPFLPGTSALPVRRLRDSIPRAVHHPNKQIDVGYCARPVKILQCACKTPSTKGAQRLSLKCAGLSLRLLESWLVP